MGPDGSPHPWDRMSRPLRLLTGHRGDCWPLEHGRCKRQKQLLILPMAKGTRALRWAWQRPSALGPRVLVALPCASPGLHVNRNFQVAGAGDQRWPCPPAWAERHCPEPEASVGHRAPCVRAGGAVGAKLGAGGQGRGREAGGPEGRGDGERRTGSALGKSGPAAAPGARGTGAGGQAEAGRLRQAGRKGAGVRAAAGAGPGSRACPALNPPPQPQPPRCSSALLGGSCLQGRGGRGASPPPHPRHSAGHLRRSRGHSALSRARGPTGSGMSSQAPRDLHRRPPEHTVGSSLPSLR